MSNQILWYQYEAVHVYGVGDTAPQAAEVPALINALSATEGSCTGFLLKRPPYPAHPGGSGSAAPPLLHRTPRLRRAGPEHVLVDVALGVALVHPSIVELLDGLRQQRRRRDAEARIFHVRTEWRALAPQCVDISRGSNDLKRDQRRSL